MIGQADEHFNKSLSTIFALASQAYEIFKSSKIPEKREIINLAFSNLKLRGKKLEYTLRKPLNLMVNLGQCPEWLRHKWLPE